MKKYWTQTQAPAGNWNDVLGTDDLAMAIKFADGEIKAGKAARVVQRVDAVAWSVEGGAVNFDARLRNRLHHYLDNTFIWIGRGDEKKKHDYRLHPMFAKDFGVVEEKLAEIVKEIYG